VKDGRGFQIAGVVMFRGLDTQPDALWSGLL
jgi:hypothetical protein